MKSLKSLALAFLLVLAFTPPARADSKTVTLGSAFTVNGTTPQEVLSTTVYSRSNPFCVTPPCSYVAAQITVDFAAQADLNYSATSGGAAMTLFSTTNNADGSTTYLFLKYSQLGNQTVRAFAAQKLATDPDETITPSGDLFKLQAYTLF